MTPTELSTTNSANPELMRHRSPSSTAIYTFVERSDMVVAVEALPIPR